MTDMTVDQAIKRISTSGEFQEVAVFESTLPEMVNCVFWRTRETQRWINAGSPRCLGVFDQESVDDEEKKLDLAKALRQAVKRAA